MCLRNSVSTELEHNDIQNVVYNTCSGCSEEAFHCLHQDLKVYFYSTTNLNFFQSESWRSYREEYFSSTVVKQLSIGNCMRVIQMKPIWVAND
jgi:hypothetical protein